MPCFAGSDNIRAVQVDNTWCDPGGTGVVKLDEGRVDTTQGEVGRMDIGTLHIPLGGKAQSWEEAAEAEVRNTHSGPASIRGRCGRGVVGTVQAVWANTGVGGVQGTGRIRLERSCVHILVHIHR